MATTIQLIRRITKLEVEKKALETEIKEAKQKLYKVKSYLHFCVDHQDEPDRIRRQLVILWKEEFEKESQEDGVLAYINEDKPIEVPNHLKATPCCKSRHWHLVNARNVPKGVIRCELCDKMHDYENLEIIQEKGVNHAKTSR